MPKTMDKVELSNVLEGKLKELPPERANYFEREMEKILEKGYLDVFALALKITNHLKEHRVYYSFGGPLVSSYVAYELQIHNVDCYRYNIQPEVCYGTNFDRALSLEITIPSRLQNAILEYADTIELCGRLPIRVYDETHNVIGFKRAFLTAEDSVNESVALEDLRSGGIPHVCLNILGSERLDQFLDSDKDLFALERENGEQKDGSDIVAQYFDKNKEKDRLAIRGEFVEELKSAIQPKTFEDLITIAGLIRGTNLWKDNQDSLLKQGIVDKGALFATRDDVFDYLIGKGFDRDTALKSMENATFGRPQEKSIPPEIQKVCKKGVYLWPRANVIAKINSDIIMDLYYKKMKFIDVLKKFVENKNHRYFDFFYNEAQFQFELAMYLKGIYKDSKVSLEDMTYDFDLKGKKKKIRWYTDIVIEFAKGDCDEFNEGGLVAIELKYKTASVKDNNSGREVLLEQGKTNLARFDFLWDIYRLESLVYGFIDKQENNLRNKWRSNGNINGFSQSKPQKFKRGYAIMLTNKNSYTKTHRDCNFKNFDIHDGRKLEKGKELDWVNYTKSLKSSSFYGRPILFREEHTIKWEDAETYFPANYEGSTKFQYTIVEVKKPSAVITALKAGSLRPQD